MLHTISDFIEGYFWATLLFPVEYYLLKPVALNVASDIKNLWIATFTKVTAAV